MRSRCKEAPDIVDETGKADLQLGPFDVDGANEQSSAAIPTMLRIAGTLSCSADAGFLIGEDVFDADRITDLLALDRRVRGGMSRCGGFLW